MDEAFLLSAKTGGPEGVASNVFVANGWFPMFFSEPMTSHPKTRMPASPPTAMKPISQNNQAKLCLPRLEAKRVEPLGKVTLACCGWYWACGAGSNKSSKSFSVGLAIGRGFVGAFGFADGVETTLGGCCAIGDSSRISGMDRTCLHIGHRICLPRAVSGTRSRRLHPEHETDNVGILMGVDRDWQEGIGLACNWLLSTSGLTRIPNGDDGCGFCSYFRRLQ